MIFSKWHGLGNDFIIAEPDKNPGFDFRAAAEHLCDRHFGIGEMCGNATRCVGLYIRRNKLAKGGEFELHTRGGIVRPKVLDNGTVRVDMGEPRLLRGEIPVAGDPEADARSLSLELPGVRLEAVGVSMGNPHAVIFVPDINAIRLEEWGPRIECDPLFPNKTNVEFVEVISPQMVRMRVWERGCGVTLACGTGSCATTVAGAVTGRTGRCITVLLDGGELQIEYSEADNHVYMTGPACEVFQGAWTERF